MAVPAYVDDFIRQAGYRYHCFVSWAQIDVDEYVAQVREIKQRILNELKLSFTDARVFLDLDDIPRGVTLEQAVPEAICQSLTMVAVCTSVYYKPDRTWPGREFA